MTCRSLHQENSFFFFTLSHPSNNIFSRILMIVHLSHFYNKWRFIFFQVYFVYPKRRKIDISSSFRSVINKVVNSGGFFFSGIYFILCYGEKFTRVNVSVDILRVQVLHIFLINKIRIGYNLLSWFISIYFY